MNTSTNTSTNIANMIEQAKAQRASKRDNNPALAQAKLKIALMDDTIDVLKQHIETATGIVDAMPLMDNRRKETRTFRPAGIYGYGNGFFQLSSLLTGIQYSATAHKEIILDTLGLTDTIVEQFVDSLGSLAYYNKNDNTVVPGTPMNLSGLLDTVAILDDVFDIEVPVTTLTEANIAHHSRIALLRAETEMQENNNASEVSEGTFAIEV